jgi:hypothetical protein
MGPEPVRHLAPRTGLLSPETREGLPAWRCLRLARSGEGRLQFPWRLVARGYGHFHGQLRHAAGMSAEYCPEIPVL